MDLSDQKGYPAFSGVTNITESVDRANHGGSLQPKELLAIAKVLRATNEVKNYLKDDDKETVLDELFHCLVPNKYLEDRISRSFVSEEEVADAASSELADIRRHMRQQSAKIKGDAAIAMISVGSLAFGYIVMSVFSTSGNVTGDVCSTLFGSFAIITLSRAEVALCVALSVVVIALFILLYNRIFAVTFDEDFAKACGM